MEQCYQQIGQYVNGLASESLSATLCLELNPCEISKDKCRCEVTVTLSAKEAYTLQKNQQSLVHHKIQAHAETERHAALSKKAICPQRLMRQCGRNRTVQFTLFNYLFEVFFFQREGGTRTFRTVPICRLVVTCIVLCSKKAEAAAAEGTQKQQQ